MNYREMTDLLAQGVNFPENAVIFVVGIDDGENLNTTVTFDGSSYNVRALMKELIRAYLKGFTGNKAAALERDILLEVFKADEERRMQNE